MKQVIALVVMAIVSGGCAQMKAAQREQDAREKQAFCASRWEVLLPKQQAQYDAFLSASILKVKIPSSFETVTYEQRTNTTLPNAAEKQDLTDLISLRKKLLSDRMGLLMDCLEREELKAYIDHNKADTATYEDLRAARLSFGDLVREIDERQQRYRTDSRLAAQQSKRRLAENEAYRAAQDKAADAQAAAAFAAGVSAAAASMHPPPQPIVIQPVIVQPAIRSPLQTTCQKWGNRMDCTTF